MFTPHNVTMSGVSCQVSCDIFFLQSGGASLWRVCYQWGLPRLVFYLLDWRHLVKERIPKIAKPEKMGKIVAHFFFKVLFSHHLHSLVDSARVSGLRMMIFLLVLLSKNLISNDKKSNFRQFAS